LVSQDGRGADVLDDLGQDGFGRLTIGMRVEIQNNAVTQDGWRDFADVIGAEIQAAAHQCEHASAFHQRLCAARLAAIADIFIGELVRILGSGLRGHDEVDGEILDVLRHQNIAAGRFYLQDGVAIHYLFEGSFIAMNGAFDDTVQIVTRG
jgi:hypothetical protein